MHPSVRRSTRRRRHTLHQHPTCARHVRSVLRRRLAVRSVHRRATQFHECVSIPLLPCLRGVRFDGHRRRAGAESPRARCMGAFRACPQPQLHALGVPGPPPIPLSTLAAFPLGACAVWHTRAATVPLVWMQSLADRASAGLCCGGAGACEAASGCAGGRRGGRGRATLRGNVCCVGLSCMSVMGMAVINRTNRERRLARNRRRAGFQVCAPRSSTRPRAGPGSVKLGSC